jgi:hypothetical protein
LGEHGGVESDKGLISLLAKAVARLSSRPGLAAATSEENQMERETASIGSIEMARAPDLRNVNDARWTRPLGCK